jgi:hypothetical protein
MPILIPALLLGLGTAGLGWAALSKRVAPSGGAVAKDLARRVANQGPKGEWVFKPEVADSLVKSLSGQTYQYVDVNLDDTVTIAPDPRGQPIPLSNTAMAWTRQQNPRLSILAPLYLATATAQKRFLRAVKPGQEQNYTGPETGYAVLLYAGAIDRNEAPPGSPPGGGRIVPLPEDGPAPAPGPKPGLPNLPPPAPSPDGFIPTAFTPPNLQPGLDAATGALKVTVSSALSDLCANGQNPAALEAVAAQAANFGFTTEAACLRARAAQLRNAQQAPPAPTPVVFQPPAPPGPGQLPTPVVFQPPVPPPPPVPVPPPTLTPNFARVTTKDAPPLGDLIIRASPSMSGPVINDVHGRLSPNQIGGAEKNGVVAVLSKVKAEGIDWSEVQWNGGTGRTSPLGWPAARGFVKSQFLVPTSSSPVSPTPSAFLARGGAAPSGGGGVITLPETTVFSDPDFETHGPGPAFSGRRLPHGQSVKTGGVANGVQGGVNGQGRVATVLSSSGMRLRETPGPQGRTISLVPAGTRIQLLQILPGFKADPRSPGPGGWALVVYEDRRGWVQSEWLSLS